MVIIELKVYGDFDIPVTHSIWINEEFDSHETPLDNFMFQNDRSVYGAIKELKRFGFRKVNTQKLTVGGNL